MKISFSLSAVTWHKFGRGVDLRLREQKKKQCLCSGYTCSIVLYASQQWIPFWNKVILSLTATLWRFIESGVSIMGLEAVGKKCSACAGNQIPIPRSPILSQLPWLTR
jgi:hypothetical protein